MHDAYEVVVVGGGTAGLSGALTLARARRSVLVVDAGAPRNAPAAGVHGFLTRDGIAPREVVALGRAEVERYGGEVADGRVTATARDGDAFVLTLDDGRVVRATAVLIATGLADELPDIPGLRERWGHDVIHCPYCHGWEIQDRAIGVVATSAFAIHQALLFSQWSKDITLFANDALGGAGVPSWLPVIQGKVMALDDDALVLEGGTRHPVGAVVVLPRMTARADGLDGLGITTSDVNGLGTRIDTTDNGLATTIPLVYVAGNAGDLAAGVVTAADQGGRAAALLNYDLIVRAHAA